MAGMGGRPGRYFASKTQTTQKGNRRDRHQKPDGSGIVAIKAARAPGQLEGLVVHSRRRDDNAAVRDTAFYVLNLFYQSIFRQPGKKYLSNRRL
jgi:hypothetical protein